MWKMADEATRWAREIEVGARAMGLDLSPSQSAAMATHLVMLNEARDTLNLTAIPTERYVSDHTLDSLSGLPEVLRAPAGGLCDLGSGAGFPGVPLGIASSRPVDLVESVKKKAEFLRRVVAELRLEATVHPSRAEELAVTHGEAFSVVIARAVARLPSLVELASPLLFEGGLLVCLKGDPDIRELEEGKTVGELVGLTEEGRSSVTVPGINARRCIIVYRKGGSGSVRLPRRNGLAQRRPLVDHTS